MRAPLENDVDPELQDQEGKAPLLAFLSSNVHIPMHDLMATFEQIDPFIRPRIRTLPEVWYDAECKWGTTIRYLLNTVALDDIPRFVVSAAVYGDGVNHRTKIRETNPACINFARPLSDAQYFHPCPVCNS